MCMSKTLKASIYANPSNMNKIKSIYVTYSVQKAKKKKSCNALSTTLQATSFF